ncbi:MAG TPA: hypothetical protein VHZ76_02395, partial [Gammaproteobacteria bacterium]|nr:hypothetical protein [Gammaproteobacteria bacterium]
MWQRLTDYLLKHRWQTAILAFLITIVPIIGVLGIIVAALIVLRKSVVDGAVVMIATTLPYLLSLLLLGNPTPAVPDVVTWLGVSVAIASNVLTWVFAVMLHRQATWSVILQVAALLGVLAVSIVHLLYPDIAEWWNTQLLAYMQAIMQSLPESVTRPENDALLEAVTATKFYMTGVMVSVVLLSAIFQLMIARWWE